MIAVAKFEISNLYFHQNINSISNIHDETANKPS